MDDGINYKPRPDCTYDYYDYPLLEECANYSLSGIIQFLQNEWTKIEIKSVQWDVERAELQAKIAYLQGERKSQENLKSDLIRRIKMLEYALKQERRKLENVVVVNNVNDNNNNTNNQDKNDTIESNILLEPVQNEAEFDDSDIYLELSKNNQKINDENSKWKDEKIKLKKMFIDTAECTAESSSCISHLNSDAEKHEEIDPISSTNSEPSVQVTKIDQHKSSTSFIDGSFKFLSNESEFIKENVEKSIRIEMPMFDPETEEALVEFDLLVNHIKQKTFVADVTVSNSRTTHQNNENEYAKVNQNFITKLKDIYVQERGPGSKSFLVKNKLNSEFQGQDKAIYDTVNCDNSLGSTDSDSGDLSSSSDSSDSETSVMSFRKSNTEKVPTSSTQQSSSNCQIMEDLSLGDLANLAVVNESGLIIADPVVGSSQLGDNSDKSTSLVGLSRVDNSSLTGAHSHTTSTNSTNDSNLLKKNYALRFTLRSHFDCIRVIVFHPQQPLLVTASEDHTLKLWNFTKPIPSKKGSVGQDVEPIYTFRGHISPVLSLCMNDKFIFSGSLDGQIRIWRIPASPTDPYDAYDNSINVPIYFQHSDAIWTLCCITGINRLLSASADGSVKCWSVEPSLLDHSQIEEKDLENHIKDIQLKCMLHSYVLGSHETDRPSCLTTVPDNPDEAVVGFSTGIVNIISICNGKILGRFIPPIHSNNKTTKTNDAVESDNNQTTNNRSSVNCIVCHPNKPITVVGYDDGYVCCFDNNSTEVLYVVSAHQLSVSCLAVDQNGTFLLSGSHDGQVRVWNLSNWTCLQEISAHRRKFEEAVLTVAFHPTKSIFATAGADALAKVFI